MKAIRAYFAKKAQQPQALVERAPRIKILPLHHIAFTLHYPEPHEGVRLSNLSMTGMALVRSTAPLWPPMGHVICGEILIHNERFAVEARIAHHSHDIVGCGFLSPDRERIREMIQKYFALELSAMELEPAGNAELQPSGKGTPHWFRSSRECELFFLETPDGISEFLLTFFGNHLMGGKGRKIRLGCEVSHPTGEGDVLVPSGAVISLPDDILSAAEIFISNLSCLTQKQREELLSYVRGAR